MEIHKHEPNTPNPTCQIKLHTPGTPIRPIINWKNAPAYNIQDSKTLFTELESIQIDRNTRICSFNTRKHVHQYILAETTNIIHNILKANPNINEDNQKEIIHILDAIMEQNYF
jgi:hypothetical protein